MAVRFDFDAPLARWSFTRAGEQLVLDRVSTGSFLIAFSGASPQVMTFEDPTEAVLFQCNLETELERSGWTLSIFESQPADDRRHPSAQAF
jgi:hypothetical protein